MEAACEIARQLRLRDLGGLVVIDFIDMHSNRHQREVENKMREAVKSDRARVQIGKISRFGLLEMSRQRLRPSIEESTQIVCPRCHGVGVIRGVESLGLSILRLLEEESMKENTRRVTVQLPVDVATFLLNEKRNQIIKIEDRHSLHILIVPNEHLETPQYVMERTRVGEESPQNASYEIKEIAMPETELKTEPTKEAKKEEPAVQNLQPTAPPPAATAPVQAQASTEQKPGLFKRVWKALFSTEEPEEEQVKPRSRTNNTRRNNNNRRRNNEGRGDNRNRNRNNRNNRNDEPRNESRNKGPQENQAETQQNDQAQDNGRKPSNKRNNRNRRDREESSNVDKKAQNNAPLATEETSTDTNVTATETTKGKEGKGRRDSGKRRSRYNSRSYNSRRRAPAGAAEMSIESPAPTTAKPVASTPIESTENTSTEVVQEVVSQEVVSQEVVSQEVVSQEVATQEVATQEVTSQEVVNSVAPVEETNIEPTASTEAVNQQTEDDSSDVNGNIAESNEEKPKPRRRSRPRKPRSSSRTKKATSEETEAPTAAKESSED